MKALFLALLLWGSAQAQVLLYADSTASLQGISTTSISRAVGSTSAFKTFWWGPYDVSECWSQFNDPAVGNTADTVSFHGYLSGIVRYAAGDTVLGRWKAYLATYPYPPQTPDGASTTWDFNWNNADSLVSYKVRAACDFVSTKRDGYPMYSRFSVNTVASDTITYPYLYIALELDSTTGTPAATNPLDVSGYWTYTCLRGDNR